MNNNCVYCHTNKINGKRYIGITQNKPNRRWQNGYGYKDRNSHFYNAIKKYGWENFEHIILEENLTRKEASEKEKYYIRLYNTNNENYGYNITSGGDNNFTRNKLTEEQRINISNKTKEAMNSVEIREYMLKVYNSEDWIRKNSEATRRQWVTSDLKLRVQIANGHKVRCVETGNIYLSILEASRQTGLSRYKITQSCQNKSYIVNNTHWEYI